MEMKPFNLLRHFQETIDEHVRNRSKDDARDFIDVYLNEMEKQNGVDPKSTFTSTSLLLYLFENKLRKTSLLITT